MEYANPRQELIAQQSTESNAATLARNSPAGAPNCGHAERKPQFWSVNAHSMAKGPDPPHWPPTPMPWIDRISVSNTAPKTPMLS